MYTVRLGASWLYRAMRMAVVAVVGITLGWLVLQQVCGYQLLQVQTGSMRPHMQPGDVLVMRPVTAAQLRPGVVVTYPSTHLANELVTHRIVQVQNGRVWTKGDALNGLDPMVSSKHIAGRVVAVLPHVGGVVQWVKSWVGLVVCVYVPAVAIAISELRRMGLQPRARTKAYYAYTHFE